MPSVVSSYLTGLSVGKLVSGNTVATKENNRRLLADDVRFQDYLPCADERSTEVFEGRELLARHHRHLSPLCNPGRIFRADVYCNTVA